MSDGPLTPPEVRELLEIVNADNRAFIDGKPRHYPSLCDAFRRHPEIRATLERYAELAEAARLVPGRWFRIVDPNGRLWTETSDAEEARAKSEETGWPIERLWVLNAESFSEWRREGKQ